jgi:hypothetical protein
MMANPVGWFRRVVQHSCVNGCSRADFEVFRERFPSMGGTLAAPWQLDIAYYQARLEGSYNARMSFQSDLAPAARPAAHGA